MGEAGSEIKIGDIPDPSLWRGSNALGQILMEVRQELVDMRRCENLSKPGSFVPSKHPRRNQRKRIWRKIVQQQRREKYAAAMAAQVDDELQIIPF